MLNPASSNVAVLGHFADGSDRVDGQILRTRIARDELSRRLGEERVVWADTGYLKQQPFRTLWTIARALKQAGTLVILPGPRGLSLFLPWYLRWKRKTGGKIHYLVIGGWLPRHLKENPHVLQRVKGCDTVHVQSRRMVRELQSLGMENVHLLPNARRFPLNRPISGPADTPLRLVFLSRITEAKGLDLAVEAVRSINDGCATPNVTLTVYGPVQPGEEEWFDSLRGRFTPEIRYGGCLRPGEINEHLIQHDVMVFPTWYSGEGFPGVLIDAMVAGIPVIASDWIDNAEYVVEGESGLLCKPRDLDDLKTKISELLEHPERVQRMKAFSAARAGLYHVEQIWPPLLQRLSL